MSRLTTLSINQQDWAYHVRLKYMGILSNWGLDERTAAYTVTDLERVFKCLD